MTPAVGIEADIHQHRRNTTTSTADGTPPHLATKMRLAILCAFGCLCCQWLFATTVVPYFSGRARVIFPPTSRGLGIQPDVGVEDGGETNSVASVSGDLGFSRVLNEGHAPRPPPRILTVLTTYNKRSSFIKPYKEMAVWGRNDGYRPTVFVASNEEDEDPDAVVDFKTGPWRQHRLLAALAEACSRYAGTFDWLAIGDDDTAFLYNRAKAVLSHIDHSQPVAFGAVDGLDQNAWPQKRMECFSPEQKQNTSDPWASSGCCRDFTNPCEVPIFPESTPPPGEEQSHRWREDYGGGGLFWPYGGSGVFVSVGFVDKIRGVDGFRTCAQMFSYMATDLQIGACLKFHGYAMGLYDQGFSALDTSDPAQIQSKLASDCQVLAVHVGIRHLASRIAYTGRAFGAAIAAVRDVDILSTSADLGTSCPEALASVLEYENQ